MARRCRRWPALRRRRSPTRHRDSHGPRWVRGRRAGEGSRSGTGSICSRRSRSRARAGGGCCRRSRRWTRSGAGSTWWCCPGRRRGSSGPRACEGRRRGAGAVVAVDGGWWRGELLVLAEAPLPFEREARTRGVAPRVHFVGRAPREAEWAWWAHARAAVIGGAGAVSGGFLLRGLSVGCPMMVLRPDATGAAIDTWLERRGALCRVAAGDDAATLARMLAGGPAVEAAIARGRSLAGEHDNGRLALQLAAALPMLAGRGADRRRPAAA